MSSLSGCRRRNRAEQMVKLVAEGNLGAEEPRVYLTIGVVRDQVGGQLVLTAALHEHGHKERRIEGEGAILLAALAGQRQTRGALEAARGDYQRLEGDIRQIRVDRAGGELALRP